VETAWVVAPQQ